MGSVFDLSRLNEPQRQAVLHEGGPLLVLAGAGSGKTRVITYRIASLLRDGVKPEHIAGVTFTNKAAREMRERLRSLAGTRATGVQLSTFHSLGVRVLKEEHEAAGLKPNFAIYDTSDQIGLVRELMRQVRLTDRRLDANRILQLILQTKLAGFEEVEINSGDDYELGAYELFPRYKDCMQAYNAIDFDDIILRTREVLSNEKIGKKWAKRYEHLLVDEYQDTSPEQLELLKVLASVHRNICVVGDDDQSIYSWRGARPENIRTFRRDFSGAEEIILDQNYRSTNEILEVANSVISINRNRIEKRLWSSKPAGPQVELVKCLDQDDEAAFVTERIHTLIYDGVSPNDIGVLYRANTQSRLFEETLAMERIPFRVVGGQSFFDRKEVRDALAYLAVAQNPFDDMALRRIINSPPRGIGPTSVQRLAAHAEQNQQSMWQALLNHQQIDLPTTAQRGAAALVESLGPASQQLQRAKPGQATPLVEQLFDSLSLEKSLLEGDENPAIALRRVENLKNLTSSLKRFEETANPSEPPLREFLRSAALTSKDEKDDNTGEVTLMTLHSAKGLEFEYVFFVGVEEGFLPHRRTMEDAAGDLSEERRLCYVGITRARQRLWLTHSGHRKIRNQMEPRTRSRFIEEIPDDLLNTWSRDEGPTEEEQDQRADAFFAKMRAQLGIDAD